MPLWCVEGLLCLYFCANKHEFSRRIFRYIFNRNKMLSVELRTRVTSYYKFICAFRLEHGRPTFLLAKGRFACHTTINCLTA